jgi:hypothetical protein
MQRFQMAMALAIISAPAISGCANLSSLTKIQPIPSDGNHWLVYDATRRGAYVRKGADGKVSICAEPFPDSVYSFINKLNLPISAAGEKGEIAADLTANAIQLAGRDRMVLVAREALFRLCEANANGSLKEGEAFDGFQEVIYMLTVMAEAERAKAISDIGKSSPQAAAAISQSFTTSPSKK